MVSKSGQSIDERIISVLYTEGKMDCREMGKHIPFKYKSISTKCLELEKNNLISRDEDRVWSLRPGVTPQTLVTGELEMVNQGQEAVEEGEAGQQAAPIVAARGVPLDQRSLFIQQLRDIGVSPPQAIPTIADIFFSGDIEDLIWLNNVLQRQAAGYVSINQRRLMMGWWSKTRGLPYSEADYDYEVDGDGRGKKVAAKGEKTEVKPERRLDPGIGWKIEKDNDREWVAVPGGPMNYVEAVEAARDRQAISAYTRGKPEAEGESEGLGEEGATARKGGKGELSLVEYMMRKMVDNLLDGGKGKASEESETVRQLTERIDTMERERQEERFDRLEGMVATIASRDPWDEYEKIVQMKERLGVGAPLVTDQSPAVQLIKDSTERADNNINRLVGIIERAVLRTDVFEKEDTRSPQDREAKAGELLQEVEGRDRSRKLRREVFGR